VVKCLSPTLGGTDGNAQIVLDFELTDKVSEPPWAETGIKRYVLGVWLTRYNTLYVNLTPCSCLFGW
jgi:hypothetical protein